MVRRTINRITRFFKKNIFVFGTIIAITYLILSILSLKFDGISSGSAKFSSEFQEILLWSVSWGLLAICLAFLQKDRIDDLANKHPLYQGLVLFLWLFVFLLTIQIIGRDPRLLNTYVSYIHNLLLFSIIGSILMVVIVRWRGRRKIQK